MLKRIYYICSPDNPNSLFKSNFTGTIVAISICIILGSLITFGCMFLGYGITNVWCGIFHNCTDDKFNGRCYEHVASIYCFVIDAIPIWSILLLVFGSCYFIRYIYPNVKLEIESALTSAKNMEKYGTFEIIDDPKADK